MTALSFRVEAADGAARAGVVTTPHGSFETPAFMPVGTQGSVKGVAPDQLAATGAGCVLGNTYHLMLRPGEDAVAKLGDLHGFMGWPGPILTDSGGFQVFSLGHRRTLDRDGVTFRSHLDGREVRLSPGRSMEVQNKLGADVIMAFDHCPPGDAPRDAQAAAVETTLRWLGECVRAHGRPGEQALFGIVQGGAELDLRERCAAEAAGFDLPGYALGGLAVGEGFEAMRAVLEHATPLLPADRPRYLMGVGYPRDIVEAVANGVDLFDCVLPSRSGRSAVCFTAGGMVRLKNARHADDAGPIEAGCDCYACRTFPRGAIRHFYMAGEMLGPTLATLHNLRFYRRLTADLRAAVGAGRLAEFRRDDPRCRLAPADPGDRPPHRHLPSNPMSDPMTDPTSDPPADRDDPP